MSKIVRVETKNKSFWICPNSTCEMIYLDPPDKCSMCGYHNKNKLENVIFDNLLAEKRGSRTNLQIKNKLGIARGLFY